MLQHFTRDWHERLGSAVLASAIRDVISGDRQQRDLAVSFLRGDGENLPVLQFWCRCAGVDAGLIMSASREHGGAALRAQWKRLREESTKTYCAKKKKGV